MACFVSKSDSYKAWLVIWRQGKRNELLPGRAAVARVQSRDASSWFLHNCHHPVRPIKTELTAFSFSKIPSITFSLPPKSASGPPEWRLLKGGS